MQAITDVGEAIYHRQLEASRDLARTLLEGTQKLESFVMDSTRKNFDRVLDFAEACVGARDAEGLTTLQYTFFGHGSDELLEAQKMMMDIALQTGVAFGRALGQTLPDKNLFTLVRSDRRMDQSKVVDAQSRAVEPWNCWADAWRELSQATNFWGQESLPSIETGSKKHPKQPKVPARNAR
jgi:hypothetical protein